MYEDLIKVLRCELYGDDECDRFDCPIWSSLGCRNGIANRAAADALEAAEKRIAELERNFSDVCNANGSLACERNELLNDVRELEAQLPKEGEWIMDGKYNRHCSRCNEDVVWSFNYCPNCGARMRDHANAD